MRIPTYRDIGYDAFLNNGMGKKPDAVHTLRDIPTEFKSALQFNASVEKITFGQAGTVSTGVLVSKDGKMKIDLDNNKITISDGAHDRVLIGYQPGGF